MRVELLPIHYSCNGCFRRLSIDYWYVGVFPLTYTVQECAEEYCELVGWKFIALYRESMCDGVYSMGFEIPDDQSSGTTITGNYHYAASWR